MNIREITKSELNIILSQLEKYDNFWNKNMYLSEYTNPNSKIYVLENLSGFFIIREGLDENFLMNIVVDKSLRGKGLGKKLLKKCLEITKGKRILLEVEEKNEIALNLYKAFGFKEISRRKRYYKEKTALIMEYTQVKVT